MSGTKNMIANRYEVIQHIGQGGMADVFLAVDTILNRQVAVKILRADLSSDKVSILRFEREAQAATALNHPNIVEIYDVGDYKGHHYIVMEYVQGRTLKQIIRERGPLMNEEAVDIMKQLTSAIYEAHKRGIIHRDIKPQNIVVKSDGTIKILDFGIATAKGSMQLTQANNVMGSVHYLAPELARGEQASVQSDIYAMGIVLFEMLAGDVPFKADQAVQIALMHMRDPLPDVRVINPNVPQSLANIITTAAAKNPSDRYRTALDMYNDLNTCLDPSRADEAPRNARRFEDTAFRRAEEFEEQRPAEEDDDEDEDYDYDDEDTFEKKIRHKRRNNARRHRHGPLIAVLLLIAAGTLFLLWRLGMFSFISSTTVPVIVGETLDQAEKICEESSLEIDTENINYQLTKDTAANVVLDCSPAAGTKVRKNTKIAVTVSSGTGETMKDYTGEDIEEAQAELESYGTITVNIEEADSSDGTPGTVIAQSGIEPGELFDPDEGGTVTLTYVPYVSGTIPSDIVGMDYNAAAKELEDMGFSAYASEIDPSTLSEEELEQIKENNLVGTVAYSDPAAGTTYTQKKDTYITLYYYSYKDSE